MPRVAIFNNYPLEEVWQEVNDREKPDHHLYGINHFHRRGYEVEIIPFTQSFLLKHINKFLTNIHLPILLGDLDQQWSYLRHLESGDLIYAPCQTQTSLLSYMRALGLLKAPIVCLAHHPLNRGRLAWFRAPFTKWLLNGTDAFPSLSRDVAATINQISNQPHKSLPLRWGPDANFYPSTTYLGQGVIAAGRTGRDFKTFGIAASQTSSQAHVICLSSAVSESFQAFGKNVRVSVQPDEDYMKYPELLELYANARVLAIPTLPGESLCGLTSLMDALGMGKPVIMTKHPLIDIDLEAEGIGMWVEPGDVEGWRNAIQFFEDNEDAALAMGQRARDLVDAGLNSMSFANQMVDILKRLLLAILTNYHDGE